MIGRQVITIAVLLFVSGTALAQGEDPTVNDSDYNTTVPTSDEAYLDEENATASGNATSSDNTSDPTVSDADFDTTVPTNDEAYLDESTPTPDAGAKGTPGLGLVGIVAGVAVLALAVRRR